MSKFKIRGIIAVIAVFLSAYATQAGAEEEIGFMQRLWRRVCGRQPAKKEAPAQIPVNPVNTAVPADSEDSTEEVSPPWETEGLTPEEIEDQKLLKSDLKREREERALLEQIRRARDAQARPQQPPR